MPADTAADDEIDTNADQEPADTGAQVSTETPGDQPEARQPEEGDQPKAGGDDSDQTSDPLVLAQMEPETQAAPATAGEQPQRTTTTPPTQQPAAEAPKPGSQDAKPKAPADQAKPAAKTEEQEPELAEALEDLPAEDWSKVSHKAKSQFLAQRKMLRALPERIKAEATARKAAEERYQAVEKFVRDQGLGDEEYVNAVAVSGLIKRNDPRAIPVLEQTLQSLRKAAGQPETPAKPTPAEPVLDDDLAAMLREAEEVGIDTSKVRARFKAPAAPPAQQPPAGQQPAGQPQAQQQPAHAGGEQAENMAIVEALMGLGVKPEQVEAHVRGLIQADPELATKPAGQRLRAVITAHTAAASKAQPQQRQPSQPPLSGRRGPPVPAGRTTTATADPLKHALKGR